MRSGSALIRTAILVALMAMTAACGNGDAASQQESASSTSEASEPIGEEQLSRAHLEEGAWPFLDLVGSGLLACEDDGSITFTPPAGGDTYAVNRIAQDAGYADIEGITVDDRPVDPILERGLELCPDDVPSGADEPAS